MRHSRSAVHTHSPFSAPGLATLVFDRMEDTEERPAEWENSTATHIPGDSMLPKLRRAVGTSKCWESG